MLIKYQPQIKYINYACYNIFIILNEKYSTKIINNKTYEDKNKMLCLIIAMKYFKATFGPL